MSPLSGYARKLNIAYQIMQEKNEISESFCQRLRASIRSSGLKQKELAKMIGISEISMSRYCSGSQKPPMDTIAAISRILNVSVQWLVNGGATIPPPSDSPCSSIETEPQGSPVPPTPEDWQRRALIAEERLARLETILKELFAFARIGQ